jgi:hypothetical protein
MPRKIRPIRIEGNIAYVPLTKGYEAIIDAADVHLVSGSNWFAQEYPRSVYAKRSRKKRGVVQCIFLHRVLMGDPEGFEIDHINGNGLDNRRSGEKGNLRVATKAQNGRNQRLFSSNTSGYKGVSFHKQASKWDARIMVDGKSRRLGLFSTPKDAAAAYAKASAELHGEFGRTS